MGVNIGGKDLADMKRIFTLLCVVFTVLLVSKMELRVQASLDGSRISLDRVTYDPVVLRQITPKTRKVRVYVEQDTTLYIKRGTKILAKRYYKEGGIKTVRIPRQRRNTRLKFYLVNGYNDRRGRIVVHKVKSRGTKRVPFQVKVKKDGKAVIRGNMGDEVFQQEVYEGGKTEWRRKGYILSKKNKITIQLPFSVDGSYCRIRLKRLGGNYSKVIEAKGEVSDGSIEYDDGYDY